MWYLLPSYPRHLHNIRFFHFFPHCLYANIYIQINQNYSPYLTKVWNMKRTYNIQKTLHFQNEDTIFKSNNVLSLERTPSSQGKNPQNFPYTNVQIFEQYIYYPPSEMVICICIIEWKSSSFHGTVQFERSGASSHKAFLLIRGKMFEGANIQSPTLQGLIWGKKFNLQCTNYLLLVLYYKIFLNRLLWNPSVSDVLLQNRKHLEI